MNKLKNTKKIYDDIKIPERLNYTVHHSIEMAQVKPTPKFYRKPLIYSLISLSAAFIIALNTSETFAQAMSEIPIVNIITKIFTIDSYHLKDKVKIVDVNIPALQNTGNTLLEKKINSTIKKQIDLQVAEATKQAQEHYDKYIAAGYEASTFLPVIINIDYEVKHSTDHIVSFIITNFEGYVSVDTSKNFYNINLKTGENLTLKNLLGTHYKDIINEQVEKQIKERQAADPNQLFFKDMGAFKGIREDQPFYINDAGNLVIVFEKYEIAPGYMGYPEFIIDAPITLK